MEKKDSRSSIEDFTTNSDQFLKSYHIIRSIGKLEIEKSNFLCYVYDRKKQKIATSDPLKPIFAWIFDGLLKTYQINNYSTLFF